MMKIVRLNAWLRRGTQFVLCALLSLGFISLPVFAGSESYGYDALGRLTGVTHADSSTESYSYDSAGNRTLAAHSSSSLYKVILVTAASNLRTLANTAGYDGSTNAVYQFIVPWGTTIKGSSGGGIAINTGTWPSGMSLSLVVNGNVYGGGGTGGSGSGNPGSGNAGSAGGDAVYCQYPISVTIASGASIKGGGGGGGSGGTVYYGQLGFRPGSGGGGGFPNGNPGTGATYKGYMGTAGSSGTESGGGAGSCGAWGSAFCGGAGGNAGNAGTAGGSGAAGGAAGYAIRSNGNTVTLSNSGTIAGSY
jgi:YD repeat-containing protein